MSSDVMLLGGILVFPGVPQVATFVDGKIVPIGPIGYIPKSSKKQGHRHLSTGAKAESRELVFGPETPLDQDGDGLLDLFDLDGDSKLDMSPEFLPYFWSRGGPPSPVGIHSDAHVRVACLIGKMVPSWFDH